MTQAKPEVPAHTPGRGPGAQLAQARSDCHFTHEEVAAKLHLSTRQIQALELDDYSSLPGPTYVRGYLKSYALLLGLSSTPILEAHARLTAAPRTPDFSTIAPQREITSRHHQVRFVTYIMAIIVIGLAIAWWQGRDTRPPNPLLSQRASEPTLSDPQAAPSPTASEEQARALVETPAVTTVTGTGTAAIAPVAPIISAPTPPPPSSVSPAIVSQAPVASPPAGVRIRLVLNAQQDSWVDIRDARQVRLLYETVPAGRSVTLEGTPPVSIFLGNAAGVQLEYNGRPVDVSRHQRGMMARFTLGEEAATAAPAP